MNRGFRWTPYGWDPYWNQNQNHQQPWAWHVRDPYWNQRTGFSNVGWNAGVPQPGGFMGHPSYNSPRPLGRHPRPPPPQQRGRVSSGGQSSNSSGQQQHRGRDLDGDAGKGLLGPGDDPSSQRGETPFLPPKKRDEFKSPELHSGQHGNGSDDNSSKSAAEKPLDPVHETPDPPPTSSTKTGLGSVVPPAVSAPTPLESPDVDVCMTERNDQGDVLGLGGYMEKKRLLSKTLSGDVEGEVKVTTKKTRLGWGQGLAKYEKQLKQQNGQKLVADGDNGETGNETVVYTATSPAASSDRPTPTPGSNVDLGSNSTNTADEMMLSQGHIGYRWNSSTSLTETVNIRPPETDFSHKHSQQPDVGGSSNPLNNILSMTETVACTATVPTSPRRSSPPPAVGGNSDPCNRISSINETVVSELASSHRCDPPPAAGLGKRRMSLTETVIPPAVPVFSRSSSTCPPPAGGGNSDIRNSSMSSTEGITCPASTHGCSLPSGANGVHDNSSMRLNAVQPADVLPPSRGCSPPQAVGDNGAPGNSSASLTAATVVNPTDSVLASSDGFNLAPDGSNAKSTKVHDIPHKLISQPINKIQNSARMPPIIIRKIQKRREFLKKNILFQEPQTNELHGSGFKAWSQEEKDVFSEKIATFGTDFIKISSFLSHKMPTDCIEYYSKHYIPECSKKSNKCVPTTKQSQEKCKNDAPSLQRMNSPTTNSSEVARLTIPKNEVAELKNLSEDSCSNGETRKGEQEIWTDKERCHLIEAIEMHGTDFSSISVHVGTKSIQQCKNFLSNGKNDLNLGKKHVNINSTIGTNDRFVSNVDSATGIIQSYSKVKENVPQPVRSADHGDGENYQAAGGSCAEGTSEIIMSLSESGQKVPNVTTEDSQTISGEENPELCAVSKECNDASEHSWNDITKTNSNTNNDNNAPSDMENPRNDNNPCISSNSAELSGHHELVQPMEDSEALKIGSKENNDKTIRDEKNPEHNIVSKEDSGILLGYIVNSQRDKEVADIISSPEGSDHNVPPMLASDGESKNFHLSSTSSSAALPTVYAKSSRSEVDIDLNLPIHVAPPNPGSVALDNNRDEASMDLHEPRQTIDVAAIMEHELSIRARETIDVDSDSEAENDVIHVSEILQSQTTIAETSHHPANQPGCIMLFGQVIYEAPSSSSGTNPTSIQGNQIVARSRDIPSETVVLSRAGGGLYPSGPSIFRRSAPVNRGQQTVLSNNAVNLGQQAVLSNNTMNLGQQAVLSNTTMPYGSTSGAAWRPLQLRNSYLVNMSQQRLFIHMMRQYCMMRGAAVPHHLRHGSSSSSSSLIDFSNFNPGQQQWPSNILDTSRVVMGYPCFPGSTQVQAPTTSNTGFLAAGRGRGQGRARER